MIADRRLPMADWKTVPLGDLVEPAQTWNPVRSTAGDVFEYIDLSAVDQDGKRITAAREVSCDDAPSRARQLVATGDILVSTVRPNLNGVARVPDHLDGATASTGFCVLRPRDSKLDGRYLFQWVKAPFFVTDMVNKATGASYPAVSDRIVFESRLPLPPMAEQRRIAEVLDRAEALRTKRRGALPQLDSLAQSLFLDLFGDPATNPKGWPKYKLGDLADQVTDGEHQTPARTIHGIKLLSARNVRDGFIDVDDVDYVSPEEHERIKRRCNPLHGDILISCSGTIGRVATVSMIEPFSLVRSVALIKPKRDMVDSTFLEHHLRTPALHSKMQRSANASSQANLFQGQIRELPAMLPPLPMQREFARRVTAVEKLKSAQRASLMELDALFASLQHRAFRGEL